MTHFAVAHLEADAEHIDFLRQALSASDIYVTPTDRGDALVISIEREHFNSTDAWNEAASVVRSVLGCLNAFANLIGPITIVPPVSAVDHTGTGETIGATLGFRLRIKSEEGKQRLLEPAVNGAGTLASRLIRIARERPDVARALSLLEDRDPSWSDIYLLMEIVEMSLRREEPREGKDWVAIKSQSWLPPGTLRALKRNAGYERHAKYPTPPNPRMSLSDAQRNCKLVVRKWLEKLGAG